MDVSILPFETEGGHGFTDDFHTATARFWELTALPACKVGERSSLKRGGDHPCGQAMPMSRAREVDRRKLLFRQNSPTLNFRDGEVEKSTFAGEDES